MTSIRTVTLIIAGLIFFILLDVSCVSAPKNTKRSLPSFLIGEFEDDYGVRYQIDNDVFRLLPNDKYQVLSVNEGEGYIVLQNDSLNAYAPSLFTRIDYQKLKNMSPFKWAFCFSSYEAASVQDAVNSVNTEKLDLMTGCNGFPFSRMKRVGKSEQ